jgi:hypothetical protein
MYYLNNADVFPQKLYCRKQYFNKTRVFSRFLFADFNILM